MSDFTVMLKVNGGEPLSTGSSSDLRERELYIDANGYLWSGKSTDKSTDAPFYVKAHAVSKQAFTSRPKDTPPYYFDLDPESTEPTIGPFKIKSIKLDSKRSIFQLEGTPRDTDTYHEYYGGLQNVDIQNVKVSRFKLIGETQGDLKDGQRFSYTDEGNMSNKGGVIYNSHIHGCYISGSTYGAMYLRPLNTISGNPAAGLSYGTELPSISNNLNAEGRLFFKIVE